MNFIRKYKEKGIFSLIVSRVTSINLRSKYITCTLEYHIYNFSQVKNTIVCNNRVHLHRKIWNSKLLVCNADGDICTILTLNVQTYDKYHSVYTLQYFLYVSLLFLSSTRTSNSPPSPLIHTPPNIRTQWTTVFSHTELSSLMSHARVLSQFESCIFFIVYLDFVSFYLKKYWINQAKITDLLVPYSSGFVQILPEGFYV